MFKENELVMYGSTGVCRVKEIGRPSFVDKDDERIYYLLEPVFQSGVIYAPIDNDKIPIRAVISAESASQLLDHFDELSQHYQSIIENHCCADLLAMTKSIYIKSMVAGRNKKHLGQIDKRYMKRAEDLIYSEIAVALDTNREDVERYIKDKLGKYII